MAPESPAADLAQGFAPLASLLRAVGPQKLSQARQHVLRFGREELLNSYRAAFAKGQRKRAFLMAECLVNHGIPPFVWHERLALESMSVNTRYDLFLADLMWLRRWHPEHHKMVRYRRCKLMLAGDDTMSHREAEFAFYQGKRPAWKLVGIVEPHQPTANRGGVPSVGADQKASGYYRSDECSCFGGIARRPAYSATNCDVRRVRRTDDLAVAPRVMALLSHG